MPRPPIRHERHPSLTFSPTVHRLHLRAPHCACIDRPPSDGFVQPRVKHFLDGKFVDSKTDTWIPLYDPATNAQIAWVPQATPAELDAAADSSHRAFQAWREVPVQQRVRVFFKYAQLIRDNTEALAALITKEQGKTLADARGDVFRGLEVVEHACSTPSLIMGETAENLSSFVDTYSYRQPLGVTAGSASGWRRGRRISRRTHRDPLPCPLLQSAPSTSPP